MTRLLTGIYAGRESLITHGTGLSVVSDNIANGSTTAFKSTRMEFGELLTESQGSLYGAPTSTGNGVKVDAQTTFHSIQGALEFTGRELDVAIQGRGYFLLGQGTDTKYSRAGNFVTDIDGNIQAQSGEAVLGFTAESPDTPVPLSLRSAGGDAEATTDISITGNLAASDPLVDADALAAGFDNFNDLNANTQFRSSIQVVDSLGTQQDVSLHYFHTGPANPGDPLTWQVQAFVDGEQVGGVAGTPTAVGTPVTLTFDGTGALQNPDAAVLNITANWANGAAASNVNVALGNYTGFSGSSSISGITSNGVVSGDVETIRFESNGTVTAILTNGEETPIGQLAIATFANPNGLERSGNNNFLETPDSGTAEIGTAQSDGRGVVNGGALESSIVDPANEFITMIRFQRGYQASSSVVQTLSEILNQTIQIA